MPRTLVSLATAALALALCPDLLPARGEGGSIPTGDVIIPEHGKYSAAYMGDWADLPTADRIARPGPSDEGFTSVTGESIRREWRDETSVHIADLRLRVRWEAEKTDKRATTLFRIVNCEEVIIENLAIIQDDPDYRGYGTIIIEGADRVVIRNLHLAGTVHSYHLRLEGCGEVFIDNVEIAGVDYHGNGRTRVGGGIWINNGASHGGSHGTGLWMPPEHVRLPGWQIVQNCYFHGGVESDGGEWRNQDALLIHHPGNGLLFNCVVENWFHPPLDGGFDISYRRSEPEYQDKFFRVEGNILRNVTLGVKTPGRSLGPTVLFFANNLFINAQIADYHSGAANHVYYVHNTHVFDADLAPPALRDMTARGASGHVRLWNYSAPTMITNSLFYKASEPFSFLYGNAEGASDKYLNVKPDHNVYAFGSANPVWYRTAAEGVKFRTLEDWRDATGTDSRSVMVNADTVRFVDYGGGDYRLRANPAVLPETLTTRYLTTQDKRMRVDRDFYGRPRQAADLAPGAFVSDQ